MQKTEPGPFCMSTAVGDNRHKMHEGKLQLAYMRVVQHRERLSKKAGRSPSLETITNEEHKVPSNPI